MAAAYYRHGAYATHVVFLLLRVLAGLAGRSLTLAPLAERTLYVLEGPAARVTSESCSAPHRSSHCCSDGRKIGRNNGVHQRHAAETRVKSHQRLYHSLRVYRPAVLQEVSEGSGFGV